METNKVYLGDCYDLIKKIPDKSIDLIITDPPYHIQGLHNGPGIFADRKHKQNYINEMLEIGIDKSFDLSILDEFCRVLKHIYIYIVIKNKYKAI